MRFIVYGIIITVAAGLILHHVFGIGKDKPSDTRDKKDSE